MSIQFMWFLFELGTELWIMIIKITLLSFNGFQL